MSQSTEELIRITYEYGITVQKIEGQWCLINGRQGVILPLNESRREALIRYKPISVTRNFYGRELDDLVDRNGFTGFNYKVSQINRNVRQDYSSYIQTENIVYLLAAVSYHCSQLSKKYVETCAELLKSPVPFSDGKIGVSGEEIFFEFDALISAIRRAYDSLRYPLWKSFGSSKGATPRSFYQTLPLCSKLPKDVAARLEASWLNYGARLTEYRDCIQHYAPIGMQTDTVILEFLDIGVLSASAWLPDNPSSKSRAKFIYKERVDALTYGWIAANEILEVAMIVLDTVNANTPLTE